MLKSSSTGKLISDISSRDKTIKDTIIPYIEIGRSKPEKDIHLIESVSTFDKYFLDYPYVRARLKNDENWNINPSTDIIDLLENLKEFDKKIRRNFLDSQDEVIPVISVPADYQSHEIVSNHYDSLIKKYKNAGYHQLALKIRHNMRDLDESAEIFKDSISKLNKDDYVLIECSSYKISSNRFDKYIRSINTNVSLTKSINKNLRVALLNPDFYFSNALNNAKVKRHNYGGKFMENTQIYGYGNYVLEFEKEFNGPPPHPFAIYYYNFKTGDFLNFDSEESYKKTLQLMRKDSEIVQLIREHSGHCSSCETYESYLEDPEFGDKDIKRRGRKGQLGKEHFITSIIVDENTHGTPAIY